MGGTVECRSVEALDFNDSVVRHYMGLDIMALSKAVYIECDGGDECDETHFEFCPHPDKRREGLKRGCHVVGKGGETIGFRVGSYSGFSFWKRHLSLLCLGVEPEEVWTHP